MRLRGAWKQLQDVPGRTFRLDKPPGGSHWQIRDEDTGRMYTVPAHNGLKSELPDVYLRGLCRCFGLDVEIFDL